MRAAEHAALHQLVQEHLETFLAEARASSDGDGLPRLVEHQLRESHLLGASVPARHDVPPEREVARLRVGRRADDEAIEVAGERPDHSSSSSRREN